MGTVVTPTVIANLESAYQSVAAQNPAAASAFWAAALKWAEGLIPVAESVIAVTADASTAAGDPKEVS